MKRKPPAKEWMDKAGGDVEEAWKLHDAHFKGGHTTTKKGPGRPRKDGHMAARSKGEVMDAGGARVGGIKAVVHAHTVKEFDKEALGALQYGFLTELQNTNRSELQEFFPPGSTGDVNALGTTVASANVAVWNRGSDEREMGREMAKTLGYGLTKLNISRQEWGQMYDRALAFMRLQSGIGTLPGATGSGGFTPPLPFPTTITSPFGVARAGGPHRGVDLSAPDGSDVRSPWPAKVLDTYFEGPTPGKESGGNVVVLALQRPDGGYANDSFANTGNDSGLLVNFIHLSDDVVEKGQEVAQGELIGHTGHTGQHADGSAVAPHLHLHVEDVTDNPWWTTDPDARAWMDPAVLWGGDGPLTGQAPPQLPMAAQGTAGVAVPAIVERGGGMQSAVVTITNGGTFQMVGQGAAVNANAKVILPLGMAGGDGGYGPVGPSRQTQAMAQGDVFTGLGALAGEFFGEVKTAAGYAFGLLRRVTETVVPIAIQGAQFLASLAGPSAALTAAAGGAGSVIGTAILPEAAPAFAVLGVASGVLGAAAPVISSVVAGGPGIVDAGTAFLMGLTPPLRNEGPLAGTGLAISPTGVVTSPGAMVPVTRYVVPAPIG